MSIRVMSMVWNKNLTSTEKLVLLYYADRASDDGSSIFPSVKTVAINTGLCERTIQATTNKLIRKGYLIREGWSNYRTKQLRISISRLIQDNQPATSSNPGKDIKNNGCNTFTRGVHVNANKGEPGAPYTSLPINKPSYRESYSKNYRNPQEASKQKYTPRVDPVLKKALQQVKEKS